MYQNQSHKVLDDNLKSKLCGIMAAGIITGCDSLFILA
jgi:hypothetical protein